MKNLSKKEWIAVAVAVIFVGYTLFGNEIKSLFNLNSMSNESQIASTTSSSANSLGVVVNDVVVGTGTEVKTGQTLSVNYVLSLSDGTVVQNSKDFNTPFSFVLGANQVIPGWEIGFTGMKVGGTRTMIIPPELAYGANAVGPIPANSTLIFTVELLSATDTAAVEAE